MMSLTQIFFILLTLISVLALVLTLPYLLQAPLSREKRGYLLTLSIITAIQVLSLFVFYKSVDVAMLIPFTFMTAAIIPQWVLLRKLDYYLEDLLHELMTLVILSTSVLLQEIYWNAGIDQLFSGIALRLGVVAITLATLGLLGIIARAKYFRWTVGIFLVLLVIKWVTFPYWGVWYAVMALLYSVLVGYVAHWQISTTKAEQVFAENTNPTIIWIVLIGIATVLVLGF